MCDDGTLVKTEIKVDGGTANTDTGAAGEKRNGGGVESSMEVDHGCEVSDTILFNGNGHE